MALKDNIKKRRAELGVTLDDVSKIVGVSRQTIQKYESGIVTNIPSDKIELLAIALKTTPAQLMGWDEKSKIKSPSKKDGEIISLFMNLSDEEKKETENFISYLKAKRKDNQ